MLYIYHYPENHKLERLNEYFIFFINSIKNVKATSRFSESYFHADFLITLNRSNELKLKFQTFFNTFKKLELGKKNQFVTAVTKAQSIELFFSDDTVNCTDIRASSISQIIGNQTFKNLTDHLFKTTLKSYDLVGHYTLIYNAMPHKICPFCGVELMHKSFRQDYDHLAAKSKYPLLSVHPKNLAPMCSTCNTKYKGEKDVLYLSTIRRKMVYPYTHKIDVSFDYSGSIIPQTDIKNQMGKWEINIIPNDDITKNWNEIYGIKKRYREDFLEPSFEEWIDDFVDSCLSSGKDLSKIDVITSELKTMSNGFKKKWYQHSNIIKAPLFDYLSSCNNAPFYNSIKLKYNNKIALI